jgi:signal transduction histidine kinase
MIRQAFQYRSGRIIALGRGTLALVFLLAAWLDPVSDIDSANRARTLLAGYAIFALAILLTTWSSWIWEQRLAALSHLVDITVFALLVALTRGYASPYFSFFVFLILSAAIRWSWREALLTSVFIVVIFLAAGYFADSDQPASFDAARFVIRGANLLVLSLTIVWFGLSQAQWGRQAPWALDAPASEATKPPMAAVLETVAAKLTAGHVLFAWSEAEEPWLHIWSLQNGTIEKARLGPEEFPELVAHELAGKSFLFDLATGNTLALVAGRRRSRALGRSIDPEFARRFGIRGGLAIPIDVDRYQGHLFALQIPGLCSDELRLAAEVREEVGAALQRTVVNLASQEAAEAQVRMMLARDLHDGVVQSFAGISLRLKALCDGMSPGSPAQGEMDKLLRQVGEEQRELRRLIASLRNPDGPSDGPEPADWFAALGARLARQWGIRCEVDLDPPSLRCPPSVQREVEQLIREAVANAVRHGGAHRVQLEVTASPSDLRLVISDDGRGFPIEGEFDFTTLKSGRLGPRSMVERADSLGGRLDLATNPTSGSRIVVTLPLEPLPS